MVNLLVLLPTYQRPDSLSYSIKSVLFQKLDLPNIKKTLYILNNDESSQEDVNNVVDEAVSNVKRHEFDNITVEHISPGDVEQRSIFRIYNVIERYAAPGDVVIIHGDDDIMLYGSLLSRYSRINKDNHCVNISKYYDGLSFIKGYDGVDLQSSFVEKANITQNKAFDENDTVSYGLPFISAYTYKINDNFWMVYKQAVTWADETPIRDNAKYLFLPFYIGLSAFKNRQLSSANLCELIRGRVFLIRKYLPPIVITHPDNPAVVNLTGMYVLRNSDLMKIRELDDLRGIFSKHISGNVWSVIFTINKIPLKEIYRLLKASGAPVLINSFSIKNVYRNLKLILEAIFNISNTGLWIRGFTSKVSSSCFWHHWVNDFRSNK